jgi:Flp pilus assembly protein TadG
VTRLLRRRLHGDDGNAMIEFIGLSVVLLLPVVYVLLTAFQLQRAAFGVSQAAREAGRAYATSPTSGLADQRAREAADLAVRDQGVEGIPTLTYTSPPSLQPGGRFTLRVDMQVPLPYAGHGRFLGLIPGTVAVHSSYTVVVDAFRAAR